nr:hypothetical protein CFP56_70038 [Quercus suber]
MIDVTISQALLSIILLPCFLEHRNSASGDFRLRRRERKHPRTSAPKRDSDANFNVVSNASRKPSHLVCGNVPLQERRFLLSTTSSLNHQVLTNTHSLSSNAHCQSRDTSQQVPLTTVYGAHWRFFHQNKEKKKDRVCSHFHHKTPSINIMLWNFSSSMSASCPPFAFSAGAKRKASSSSYGDNDDDNDYCREESHARVYKKVKSFYSAESSPEPLARDPSLSGEVHSTATPMVLDSRDDERSPSPMPMGAAAAVTGLQRSGEWNGVPQSTSSARFASVAVANPAGARRGVLLCDYRRVTGGTGMGTRC